MNQEEFNEYRKSKNFCHVYAATQWHDDVYIVGDVKALTAIKNTIERALQNITPECCTLRPNDYETYRLHVIKTTNPEVQDKLVLPYTEDFIIDKTEDKIHPFQLLHDPKLKNNL